MKLYKANDQGGEKMAQEKKEPSRRDFIKTLAGLGLGAAMAQTLYSSLNPKQRAQLVAWAQSYGKPMTYAELGRLIDAAAWDDVVRAVRYQPANYIIYQAPDGSYQAKNGNTGQIEFSDTDAASVIQGAINAAVELTKSFLPPNKPRQPGIAFGGGPRITVMPGQYLLNRTLQFPAWGQYTFDAQYATLMYTPTTGDAVIMDSAYWANIFIGQIVTQSANGAAFRIKPTNLDLYNNNKYVYGCKFNIVAGPSSNPWASGTYGVVLDISNPYATIQYCDISVDYVQFFDIGVYVTPRATAAVVRRNRIKVMAEACNTSFKTSDQGFVFNQVEVFSFNQGARSPGVGLDLTGSTNDYTYVSDGSATTDIIFESPSQYERVKALHPIITYSNLSASNTSRIDLVKGLGFSITTPAMPASGTAQTNTFPFPVIVYLYGGTVTQITINGQVVFSSATGISLTGQSFTLNPGDTIAITYTAAPTWKWYGL